MKIVAFQCGLGNQIAQYVFFLFLQKKGHKVYPFFVNGLLDEHYGFELNKVLLSPQILSMPFWMNIAVKILRRFPLLQSQAYDEYKYKILYNGYYFERKYFDELSPCSIQFDYGKMSAENWEFINKNKDKLLVSVHIRRGDYLKSTAYSNVCTDFYYKQAIRYIEEKYSNILFVFFSDDLEYVKKTFSINHAVMVDWNQKENSYMDMLLMSCCSINIIANSSFSYWAARLNENNILTIYPQKWWAYSPIDFFPDKWIALSSS